MSTPSIRTGKQFVLWVSIICAAIFAPAALLLCWLSRSVPDGTLRVLGIALTVAAASAAAGTWAAVLTAYLVRTLLLEVRALVPGSDASWSRPRRLSALFAEFSHLLAQVAEDQQALRRHNRQLRVLAAISQSLNRASSPGEMLDMVLEHAMDLLPYERGYIALADQETGEFRILASRGYMPAERERLLVHTGDDDASTEHVHFPLYATSGVIGEFYLDAHCPDEDIRHLIRLLVEILAAAIEKHRLFEATQREVRAQTLLNEAGRALTSTLDKQEVLTRVMGEVIQVLHAKAGSVLLVDEAQGDIYFAAAATPAVELLMGTRMAMDQGIVGWTIQHRESVLVDDAPEDPRFYAYIDQQTGLQTRSVVCVPLLSKDRAIGAIEVIDSKRGNFSQYDLRLLESLAPQAVIAIENASLHESIKAQMAELERTQDQLLQAEKLSAIGQLVAGVAHELNNPLTAIVGYAQLLLETCEDQEICEDLARIDREAQRSARIVQNLLSFARQNKMEKRPFELGDALNATIDLLGYQLEVDNITVVREIDPNPMIVLGDVYQLQQVFLNLINNAHQAMRKVNGSGKLTIRASATQEGAVRVSFDDDGPGIPREYIHRVFDPFFTTKDVGEGTGLGLSICLGIVQEHQGRIWVESELEQGATFYVELPLYEGRPSEADGFGRADTPVLADKWDILVVDDEVEIANLLKRILEAEGHIVTAVDSGLDARNKLDQHRYDLVICDLKMPGMGGRELYTYLRQTQPDVAKQMVFTTGDVVSDESQAFLHQVGKRFLSKPFKADQVLALIQESVSG
jgi:signal transduction histidine kinase/ActR/RegA family two-component response regulator